MNDNLYNEIKQSGLKLNYIAERLGISRKGLYLKLKGKIILKKEEENYIRKLLNKLEDNNE